MLPSGIDQIKSLEDLEYPRQALRIGLTDEEAAQGFEKAIEKSTANTAEFVHNLFHVLGRRWTNGTLFIPWRPG